MGKPAGDIPERGQRRTLIDAFPAAYVASGLNGTKAVLAIKPHLKPASARSEAPHILAIASVQERIRALLPSEAVEAGVIRQALARKPRKEMSWGEKHRYLETSLKLKGLLRNHDDTTSVQVGIVIER